MWSSSTKSTQQQQQQMPQSASRMGPRISMSSNSWIRMHVVYNLSRCQICLPALELHIITQLHLGALVPTSVTAIICKPSHRLLLGKQINSIDLGLSSVSISLGESFSTSTKLWYLGSLSFKPWLLATSNGSYPWCIPKYMTMQSCNTHLPFLVHHPFIRMFIHLKYFEFFFQWYQPLDLDSFTVLNIWGCWWLVRQHHPSSHK